MLNGGRHTLEATSQTSVPLMDFASLPIPPRLTPSPPPYLERTPSPSAIPLNPPLRKSIYPHPTNSTWHVTVLPPSPLWPCQFMTIQSHLHNLFTTSIPPAPYLTIEHIGSTAIPDLPAKPNIDVLVTFASEADLTLAVEALNWEIPNTPPYTRYTQIYPRGGGIAGRESFKLYLPEDNLYYTTTPERSVYLIADIPGNEAGRVQIRCYRTLKNVLLRPENGDLRKEYGNEKLMLGGQIFWDALEYSARKDEIVKKILKRGGWTDEEVTTKEELTRRVWTVNEDNPY